MKKPSFHSVIPPHTFLVHKILSATQEIRMLEQCFTLFENVDLAILAMSDRTHACATIMTQPLGNNWSTVIGAWANKRSQNSPILDELYKKLLEEQPTTKLIVTPQDYVHCAAQQRIGLVQIPLRKLPKNLLNVDLVQMQVGANPMLAIDDEANTHYFVHLNQAALAALE